MSLQWHARAGPSMNCSIDSTHGRFPNGSLTLCSTWLPGTSYTDVAKKLFGAEHDDADADGEVAGVQPIQVPVSDETGPGDLSATASEKRSDDDALIAGLRTSAAQLSFAEIEDQEELKRVAEGGDFEAWRVFLHPEQRRWAQRGYNGPFRLSGGAGTGKTVVLVHRAVRLAKAPVPVDGLPPRVVLTTFTRNLASELEAQVSTFDSSVPRAGQLGNPGLYVAGVDQLASRSAAGSHQRRTHAGYYNSALGPTSCEYQEPGRTIRTGTAHSRRHPKTCRSGRATVCSFRTSTNRSFCPTGCRRRVIICG
jgi:hypothetical protein